MELDEFMKDLRKHAIPISAFKDPKFRERFKKVDVVFGMDEKTSSIFYGLDSGRRVDSRGGWQQSGIHYYYYTYGQRRH